VIGPTVGVDRADVRSREGIRDGVARTGPGDGFGNLHDVQSSRT